MWQVLARILLMALERALRQGHRRRWRGTAGVAGRLGQLVGPR